MTKTARKLSQDVFKSVEKQLHSLGEYSVPILAEQVGGLPWPLGTGWFFRIGLHWFLVTAAHVLRELYPKHCDPTHTKNDCDVVIPGVGEQRVHLSGKATMTPSYDVGVLHLDHPELIRDRWTPVTMLDLVRDDDPIRGWYFIAGWPGQLCLSTNTGITTKRFQLVAPFGANGMEFDSDADILLSLNRNDHKTLDGQPVSVPALEGISGSPVWRIFEDQSTSYRPRLAGIQTGYIDCGAVWTVHATRCGVIRRLIEEQVPGIFSASERLVPS